MVFGFQTAGPAQSVKTGDPKQKKIVDNFLKNLKKADELIEQRNQQDRKVPYLLMQPSKVPCSIAI